MARMYLCIVVLFAVAGCDVGGDGEDNPGGVPRNSDIEVKQGAVFPVGCAHSPCKTGGILTAGCGPNQCTAWICSHDPFCCSVYWDAACVAEVGSICQLRCDCGTICTEGNAFYPDACNCTADIYGVDPYCSDTYWDSICIGEANSICNAGCP